MARGPICGATNPWYVSTPGPTGCNDAADPNNPVFELVSPMPLGLARKKGGKAERKSTAERERGKVDAVAKLTKPSASKIQEFSAAIDNVRKLSKECEISNKTKDEELRLKKEKVVKDIVKAYGIGLKHVTGLEFSNRDDSNLADTRGTFITAFDGILIHPGFLASVILHESSHAQRNAELTNAGVDRSKLGFAAEDIWRSLIEGYQLEIDSAAKTGITAMEKKAAMSGRDGHLSNLEVLMGKETRKEIENGGLDNVRARFIRQQLKPRP